MTGAMSPSLGRLQVGEHAMAGSDAKVTRPIQLAGTAPRGNKRMDCLLIGNKRDIRGSVKGSFSKVRASHGVAVGLQQKLQHCYVTRLDDGKQR